MTAPADIRKLSLVTVVIISMIAVLLPLCMAASCGMGMGGMGGLMGLGFNSNCATSMASAAQAAITPAGMQSLILMLAAAFGMAILLIAPPFQVCALRLVAEDPPARPEDPRGVRLII